MKKGLKKALPQAEIILCSLADGGQGTVEALVRATKGKLIKKQVTGPLGEPVQAYFGLLGSGASAINQQQTTAVIEMAAASGLHLVPREKRDPMLATSYGTGELIKEALDCGAREIFIGVGDSATTDGGLGLAQALGAEFFGKLGELLGRGGKELKKLQRIDLSGLDPRIKKAKFLILSDVDNPLFGPQGAAYVYAPQKGATEEEVTELDAGLRNLARVIKKDLGMDIADFPGAGAAGGLGAGLKAFLKAKITPGADFIIKVTRLERKLKGADLVITGEGKIDAQTSRGKTPMAVAKLAKERNIPLFAVGGQVSKDAAILKTQGVTEFFSLTELSGSVKESREKAAFFLEKTAELAGTKLLQKNSFKNGSGSENR